MSSLCILKSRCERLDSVLLKDQIRSLSGPSILHMKDAFVQTDNIQTVPEQRLVKYLGTLDGETMREVSKKVILALELESCLEL